MTIPPTSAARSAVSSAAEALWTLAQQPLPNAVGKATQMATSAWTSTASNVPAKHTAPQETTNIPSDVHVTDDANVTKSAPGNAEVEPANTVVEEAPVQQTPLQQDIDPLILHLTHPATPPVALLVAPPVTPLATPLATPPVTSVTPLASPLASPLAPPLATQPQEVSKESSEVPDTRQDEAIARALSEHTDTKAAASSSKDAKRTDAKVEKHKKLCHHKWKHHPVHGDHPGRCHHHGHHHKSHHTKSH